MALEIVIRSEDDAWKWLKKTLNGKLPTDEPIDLRFDGWPNLDLRFTGHDFDSSVPTRIMPPLLDAQKEIHRLYCQLHYGQQNLRKLKAEDRERLELVVKVNKGSSEYLTNLSKTLTEIAKSAVTNMESTHLMYTLLGGALVWGSSVAWKAWLTSQEKQKEIDSRVKMSALEREKLETLSKAYQKEPALKELSKGVNEFRNDSLHKLKPSDSFSIPNSNIEVDGRYASEITNKPKEQSIEIRIDGEFIIQQVTSGETKGFKMKVKRVLDGKIINVSIPEGILTIAQTDTLKNNEWNKKAIVMQMNAKELRGEITSAILISATETKIQ